MAGRDRGPGWREWAARLATIAALIAPDGAAAQEVIVFAAASLKGALDEVAAGWQAETGGSAVISYAASSALARQIEAGAPADLFLSADRDWMDYLAEHGLIDEVTRRDLLGNRLVLIATGAGTAEPGEIGRDYDLGALLGDGFLAMGDPAAVPAGRYGRAALESLGLWAVVEARVAAAENVRAALLLVARGEAPAGIVYATDAIAEPGVRVIGFFPEESHPPIVYPGAVTAESAAPAAQAYLDHLGSEAARTVFAKHGFTPVD